MPSHKNQEEVIRILNLRANKAMKKTDLVKELNEWKNAKNFNANKVLNPLLGQGCISLIEGNVILNFEPQKNVRGNDKKKTYKKGGETSKIEKHMMLNDTIEKKSIGKPMNLFDFSKKFIIEQTMKHFTDKTRSDVELMIDNYLSVTNATKDLDSVFKELCSSLQTSAAKNNTIGFYRRERHDKFKEAFMDYDVNEIAKLNESDIYDKLSKEFSSFNNIDLDNQAWQLYIKGVTKGAKIISKFQNYDELVKFINSFENDPRNTKHYSFSKYQKNCKGEYKIPLMGEVIANNWLKEIGFNLGKPDTHILGVFVECGILEPGDRVDLIDDCNEMFKKLTDKYKLDEKYNNVGTYALDKVIWLCCSGHLYRDDCRLKPKYKKDELITFDGIEWPNIKKIYIQELLISIANGSVTI